MRWPGRSTSPSVSRASKKMTLIGVLEGMCAPISGDRPYGIRRRGRPAEAPNEVRGVTFCPPPRVFASASEEHVLLQVEDARVGGTPGVRAVELDAQRAALRPGPRPNDETQVAVRRDESVKAELGVG